MHDSAQTSNIVFFQLGDWGGDDVWPYYTVGQLATANAMGAMALEQQPQFILALGDNFYEAGLQNSTSAALRFQHTYEHVYDAASLVDIPWYVNAGNHDHMGKQS